tara:strand:+ start:304 stop:696 length:393 start_codon:yes stop_codon:yes gene_type:complete
MNVIYDTKMAFTNWAGVIDMFENTTDQENFEDYWHKTWDSFEKRCKDVVRHKYIMKIAFKTWKPVIANPGANIFSRMQVWEHVFIPTIEKKRLKELCENVGIEPTEFVDLAYPRHMQTCLEFWNYNIIGI